MTLPHPRLRSLPVIRWARDSLTVCCNTETKLYSGTAATNPYSGRGAATGRGERHAGEWCRGGAGSEDGAPTVHTCFFTESLQQLLHVGALYY